MQKAARYLLGLIGMMCTGLVMEVLFDISPTTFYIGVVVILTLILLSLPASLPIRGYGDYDDGRKAK